MAIGNLKGATVAIASSWKATSKYGIFNIKGTLNGTAFTRLYIGYSGTSTGSANRIYYLKSSGSYASVYSTTALNFVFDNSSDITDTSFISWIESNNATITGGYKAGKGIKIGDKTIKLVRHGFTLVREIYNGDTLIYRAFHNYIEGYSNYLLPAQGNGSTFTFPAYSGSNPPGEYFDHYLFKGQTYYPGDTYTYEDNPFLAEDKSLFSGETPYYYPDHISAVYSSDGGGSGGDTPPGIGSVTVVVSGFDVDINDKRVGLGNARSFEGEVGSVFSYTINSIYSWGGFTKRVEGLTYAGIAEASSVVGLHMIKWEPDIEPSLGSASSPTLVSGTQNRTLTIRSEGMASVVEYYCIYQYDGYYFI